MTASTVAGPEEADLDVTDIEPPRDQAEPTVDEVTAPTAADLPTTGATAPEAAATPTAEAEHFSGSGSGIADADPTVVPTRSSVSSASADTHAKPFTAMVDLAAPVRAATVDTLGQAAQDIAESTVAVLLSAREVVSAPAAAVTASVAPVAQLIASPGSVAASAEHAVPLMISEVLAAVGLSPLVTDTPIDPVQSPVQWALLASARRELGVDSAPQSAAAAAVQPDIVTTAAVIDPLPNSLDSTPIGWVTGQVPSDGWPLTNNTQGFGIYGTDLGILWENGLTGKIQLAFGDTFSAPNMTGNWRSNVILLSTDNVLSNGLDLLPTGYAYQFIPSAPGALFLSGLLRGIGIGSEVTVIPTAAVSVLDEQYVNYMSVKSWDSPGSWITNYSDISMFNQQANRWDLVPSTIRSAGWLRSATPYVAGNQNFQQMAYVLQPEDQVAEGQTRYLYAFGTPSGRQGSAYLSRVPEASVTDLSTYDYWNGTAWVRNNPAAAAPIIGDSTSSPGLFGWLVDLANDPGFFGGYFAGLFGAKTGGNVGEMSVQYNEYLQKYVILYTDGNNDVQMRLADTPEGAWSKPITLATSAEYPGLYAPMIHPWSGTKKLKYANGTTDETNLYWNMSMWGPYNVVLMQTDLTTLHDAEVLAG